MIRATIWTVGLFGAGSAISGMFTSGWSQPLVLLVLGAVFLFVSRTAATAPAADATQPRAAAPDVVATLSTRPAAAEPAAAPVPVPVEQSA
jgi:hypothetical protein